MSDDIVIRVENLSKQYRIGTKEGYKAFRETFVDAAKAPFQRLKSAFGRVTNQAHETNSTNKTTCMNKKDRKSQEQTPKDNLYGMRGNL